MELEAIVVNATIKILVNVSNLFALSSIRTNLSTSFSYSSFVTSYKSSYFGFTIFLPNLSLNI